MGRLHLTFHNTFIHINSNHHLSRPSLLREAQRPPSPACAVLVQGLRGGGCLLWRQDLRIAHQLALPGEHLRLDPRRLPVDPPPEPAAAAAVLPPLAPLQAERAARRKPPPAGQMKEPHLPRQHSATLAVRSGMAEPAEAGAVDGRRHGGARVLLPPPRRQPETIQQRTHGSAA